MDLKAYLDLINVLAGMSSTTFAILLGFTLFMLNQGGKKVELGPTVLLGLGIFGSLFGTVVSAICLIFGAFGIMNMDALYLTVFLLFMSMASLGILAFLILCELYGEKVKEDRTSGRYDYLRLK